MTTPTVQLKIHVSLDEQTKQTVRWVKEEYKKVDPIIQQHYPREYNEKKSIVCKVFRFPKTATSIEENYVNSTTDAVYLDASLFSSDNHNRAAKFFALHALIHGILHTAAFFEGISMDFDDVIEEIYCETYADKILDMRIATEARRNRIRDYIRKTNRPRYNEMSEIGWKIEAARPNYLRELNIERMVFILLTKKFKQRERLNS